MYKGTLRHTPPKIKQAFEDVSPLKNGNFSASHVTVVFGGVLIKKPAG